MIIRYTLTEEQFIRCWKRSYRKRYASYLYFCYGLSLISLVTFFFMPGIHSLVYLILTASGPLCDWGFGRMALMNPDGSLPFGVGRDVSIILSEDKVLVDCDGTVSQFPAFGFKLRSVAFSKDLLEISLNPGSQWCRERLTIPRQALSFPAFSLLAQYVKAMDRAAAEAEAEKKKDKEKWF